MPPSGSHADRVLPHGRRQSAGCPDARGTRFSLKREGTLPRAGAGMTLEAVTPMTRASHKHPTVPLTRGVWSDPCHRDGRQDGGCQGRGSEGQTGLVEGSQSVRVG